MSEDARSTNSIDVDVDLDDLPDKDRPTNADVYAGLRTVAREFREFRREVRPALLFYERTLGVLAVAKFLGVGGLATVAIALITMAR